MRQQLPHFVGWRNNGLLPRAVLVAAITLSLLSMLACSGQLAQQRSVRSSSGNGFIHPTLYLALSVVPADVVLPSGGSRQFTVLSGTNPITNVVWYSSMGTVSPDGFFTAPNVSADTSVRITATDSSEPNRSASAVVAVEARESGAPPTGGDGGKGGNHNHGGPGGQNGGGGSGGSGGSGSGGSGGSGSGGSGGSGSGGSGGSGSGGSGGSGSGGSGGSGSGGSGGSGSGGSGGSGSGGSGGGAGTTTTGPDNRYCEVGNIANFGGSDGPATLPSACFYTALAATPSPGSIIAVGAEGDLQNALNQAQCGDTITLQAGASYLGSAAGYVLPAKNCDNNHWITIRTSASNSSLPAEGSRLTPCYSGVSSLPGRPPFSCPTSQVVTAQVLANVAKHSPGAFVLSPGANHYRFIGLEITRPVSGGTASLVKTSNSTQVIFDRVWIHGTPSDDTATAIGLDSGSSYIALIDSYTSDFHCEAVTGTCTDSHVVFGGLGDLGGGPYKVVDDFIEAAAEGMIFGGGAATTTPGDIEIRRNHFFKPFNWQPGNPSFVGGPHNRPFIVKNSFELKNAQRVLLEGNLMEDVWGGFSQNGFQIVLTPKSQFNKCPICVVANVTVRYNQTNHSGAGLTVSAARSDQGGSAQGVENVSIHDNVIDDVNASQFMGGGGTLGLSAYPQMFWRNVTINHITASSPSWMLMVIGSIDPSPMTNLVLTNSILTVGKYQITGTGAGTTENCAYNLGTPAAIIAACFTNYTVAGNVIADGTGATWPAGQSFPTIAQIGFVNYANGNGGNYELCQGANNPASSCAAASPYVSGKTTDGLPAGADIDAVNQAIAGVD